LLNRLVVVAFLGAPAVANATTVTFVEQNYYATYTDYVNDSFVGGGEALGDGGSVSNDNGYVAHRIRVSGPVEGDLIEWETTDPSGNLEEYRWAEYVWSDVDDAYCFVGSLQYCGPNHTTTWTWLWNILFHETGTYTTDVMLNGGPMLTTTYIVTSGDGGGGDPPPDPEEDQCLKGAGDSQIEPNGTTLQPYTVTHLDADGEPQSGKTVTFEIVDSPKGAKNETLESGGIFSSTVDATTDADGVATATLTFGNKDGDYQVLATCANTTHTFDSVAAPYVTGITGMDDLGPRPDVQQYFSGTLAPGAGVYADSVGVFGGLVGAPVEVEALIASEYDDLTDVSVVWSAEYSKPGAKGKGTVFGGEFYADWDDALGAFYANFDMTFPIPETRGRAVERPTNDAFGWHDLTLSFSFYEGDDFLGDQTIESQLVLYFPRDDVYPSDAGGDVPNWAYYWSQIPELEALEDDPADLQPDRSILGDGLPGPDQLMLDMYAMPAYLQGSETGTTDPATAFYTVDNHSHRFDGSWCNSDDLARLAYQPVPGKDGPFERVHTDTHFCGPFNDANHYGETVAHEHVHMTDWYYFWAPEYAGMLPDGHETWTDADDDGYPDELVPITVLHLFTAQTEALWQGGGNQWRRDAIAAQDWAFPGAQSL